MKKQNSGPASTQRDGFTLIELLVVITIIGILANIGLNTFTSAQKKSRDAQRKGHLKQLKDALEAYYNDQGEYPDDNASGNIMGCGADALELCTYGTSSFSNTTTDTVYMIKMPADPALGSSYYYDAIPNAVGNNSFQLYTRLENTRDIAVHKDVDDNPQVYDSLNCGTLECNYGIGSTNITPEQGRTLTTE
ncbi:type II secretion system protein [Patescibacteria group bacterium]